MVQILVHCGCRVNHVSRAHQRKSTSTHCPGFGRGFSFGPHPGTNPQSVCLIKGSSMLRAVSERSRGWGP
jgi:hypothetical protein